MAVESKRSAAADGTQAIARAAALLRALARLEEKGFRLVDLAAALGLERPTVHRILRRLVDERLVVQNPADRTYRLGPLVYELGLVAEPPVAVHASCDASLDEIAALSGDTVFAFIASSYDVVCIDRREGSYPVKALLLPVGGRRPLGTGAGSLALLSALSEAEAGQVLTANAARLQALGEESTQSLRQMVDQGRADGFVAKHPVPMSEILSLAVPVCDAVGRPLLALSVSALTYRIRDRMDMLVPLLRREAATIASRLAAVPGGQLPRFGFPGKH